MYNIKKFYQVHYTIALSIAFKGLVGPVVKILIHLRGNTENVERDSIGKIGPVLLHWRAKITSRVLKLRG